MQANSLAVHEFGKDLERHVGSVNMAAILLASAVGSGLAATHFGLGASAVPLGASGGRCHVVRRRHAALLVPFFSVCFGEVILDVAAAAALCGQAPGQVAQQRHSGYHDCRQGHCTRAPHKALQLKPQLLEPGPQMQALCLQTPASDS